MAWGLALILVSAWIVLILTGKPIFRGMPFLSIFMLFAALSISLSNWMDRRSRIRISQQGILFENGLRHTELDWDEIEKVQVFPSQWGKKVRVIGNRGYFAFRTLGEVKVQGETKGRMGFAHGEMILRQILERTSLEKKEQSSSGVYYARS